MRQPPANYDLNRALEVLEQIREDLAGTGAGATVSKSKESR